MEKGSSVCLVPKGKKGEKKGEKKELVMMGRQGKGSREEGQPTSWSLKLSASTGEIATRSWIVTIHCIKIGKKVSSFIENFKNT